MRRFAEFFRRHPLVIWVRNHPTELWWFHSAYSLALGIGFMWLGARNFTYLRLAVFHVAFIWISNLLLPLFMASTRLPPPWRHRLRLLINYFNRNFYQQILFFILPIYYSSATFGAGNFLFVIVLAVSAVFSTLDRVYDHFISTRWAVLLSFFAFNLFTAVNVMLPILFRIPSVWAIRLSALVALCGFVSVVWRLPEISARGRRAAGAAAVVAMVLLAEFGRVYIPPAPLRLAAADFGTALQRAPLKMKEPTATLPAGFKGRLYVLTAVHAPLGLRERVCHIWYSGGRPIYRSPFYSITGGRALGYRLWTTLRLKRAPLQSIVVDVETEGGQLIGRSRLAVREGDL